MLSDSVFNRFSRQFKSMLDGFKDVSYEFYAGKSSLYGLHSDSLKVPYSGVHKGFRRVSTGLKTDQKHFKQV